MGYFWPNYQQGFSLRVSVVRASNHNTCWATFEYATHNTVQIGSQKYVWKLIFTYLPQALYWIWTLHPGAVGVAKESKKQDTFEFVWFRFDQSWKICKKTYTTFYSTSITSKVGDLITIKLELIWLLSGYFRYLGYL